MVTVSVRQVQMPDLKPSLHHSMIKGLKEAEVWGKICSLKVQDI